MRMLRVVSVVAFAIAACFVTATAASAHDVLESTSPSDGATVQKAPHKIVLTFAAPAEKMGTTLAVSGPHGTVDVSDAKLVNNTVEATIGGDLPAGKYTVDWRVTSADGHPVSGTFAFSTTRATSYPDPDRSGGGISGSANGSSSEQAAPEIGQDSATSTSSGTVGAILIVIGIALAVIILIVIGVLTLRRRRPTE